MRQDRTSYDVDRIHQDRCSTTRIAISISISRETFLQSRLIKTCAFRNRSTNKRILRMLCIETSNYYTFFNIIQVKTECAKKRPKNYIFINVLLNIVSFICVHDTTCLFTIFLFVYYSLAFAHVSISSRENYPDVG